ncbi:MAG TPA: helix-turn-helix domain-containing protein, partial [Bacillota bacterium]|nr:helix-turn-helix domain-containing protein [Bacillota bacterium]
MGQFGEQLRSTRESKGLTLQQVEEETNMRWKYIEALEEENFDVIPGKAYVKGFLRNYAAFLELDPEEILEQYHANFETVKVVVPAEE